MFRNWQVNLENTVYLNSSLSVKAVKAFINVFNVSYKSCTLLWYAKNFKVFTRNIYVYVHKIFSPGLPNLGTQIRCAQSRYTAVQTDLKYPPWVGDSYSIKNQLGDTNNLRDNSFYGKMKRDLEGH